MACQADAESACQRKRKQPERLETKSSRDRQTKPAVVYYLVYVCVCPPREKTEEKYGDQQHPDLCQAGAKGWDGEETAEGMPLPATRVYHFACDCT